MSTKVYNAYKLKDPADLWAVIRDIRTKGQANVQHHLKKEMLHIASGINGTTEEFLAKVATFERVAPDLAKREALTRLTLAHDVLRAGYREATTSLYRSAFNFDAAISVRHYEGQVYLRAHTDLLGVLDFLKRDKRLEDFHYQNCTDKPSKITQKDWQARRAVWDGMVDSGTYEASLVLHVCEWNQLTTLLPSAYCLVKPYQRWIRQQAQANQSAWQRRHATR